MPLVPSVLAPTDCSPQDLTEFRKLVIAGGAVDPAGLTQRIRRAFLLYFLRTASGEIVGIAALKHPNSDYRADIFHKARSRSAPEVYTIELGWVVVADSHKGQRLPRQIISELLPHASGESIFATTRDDKRAMHYALVECGFKRDGEPYRNERDNYNLVLYVRPP